MARDFISQAESGEDIHNPNNPNMQLGLATPIQNQRPDKSQLMETDSPSGRYSSRQEILSVRLSQEKTFTTLITLMCS